MDDAPLDILVPYAGSGSLLRETVASVLAQDDGSWRLLVVEDGPQDSTVGPWLRALGDSRVRHVVNPENHGVAGNFQRCLELATGEYVTFLGCDDRLRPEYVSTVRRGLSTFADIDVVLPGVRVIDAGGRLARPLGDRVKAAIARVDSEEVREGERLLAALMHGNWAYFPAVCWRRDLIVEHGFRQDLDTVLDLALLARVVLGGARLLVQPDVVFEYRRHAGSYSSQTALDTRRFGEERLVMNEVAAAAASQGWAAASRAARWRLTSRLHAALYLPRALRRRDSKVLVELSRHVFRGWAG